MNEAKKTPTTGKQSTKPKKERAKKYDEKVTLAPITFEEAIELAVKTKVK
jgi:hypothetical protein